MAMGARANERWLGALLRALNNGVNKREIRWGERTLPEGEPRRAVSVEHVRTHGSSKRCEWKRQWKV